MKAWYFSKNDRKLRYGDDRIIASGITHKVDCEPILCKQGLHGSVKILDALNYAPGDYVWRVELSGDIVRGDDKIVATERTYLWGYNAASVLYHFAQFYALENVIHLAYSARSAAWASARSAVGNVAKNTAEQRLYKMIMRGRP